MTAGVLDDALLRAYRETRYRVDADPPFALRVDRHSPALCALLARSDAQCAAFITASNPASVALPAARNAERQDRLRATLVARGLRHVDGSGEHPDGTWPAEPSFLVLDLTLDAARALAAGVDQNAILWSGPDCVPRLVLLR